MASKFFVQCITKQLLDSVFGIYRIIKVSVRAMSPSLVNSELTLSKQVLVTCQGKIWLIFLLVTAVGVAVSAKSGTPGKRDLISLTRPQNFLNEVFLFELNHIVLF